MFIYNIMKSFYISVVLFAFLLALIATNSIHLKNTVNDLIDHVDKISIDDRELFNNAYNIAYDKWQKLKTKAKLSCCHSEISAIDVLFEQLKVYADQGNHYDFATAKRVLIFNLNELTRLEKAFD